MKFNVGQWALKLGTGLLSVFASKGKLKTDDIAQVVVGATADEVNQDNQPK